MSKYKFNTYKLVSSDGVAKFLIKPDSYLYTNDDVYEAVNLSTLVNYVIRKGINIDKFTEGYDIKEMKIEDLKQIDPFEDYEDNLKLRELRGSDQPKMSFLRGLIELNDGNRDNISS